MRDSKIHHRRNKTLKVTQAAVKRNGARIYKTGFVRDLQDSYDPNFEWATEKEIGKASKELLQIRKHGLGFERRGDFFKSGEIAFKIREILREINKATQSCQRTALTTLRGEQAPEKRASID